MGQGLDPVGIAERRRSEGPRLEAVVMVLESPSGGEGVGEEGKNGGASMQSRVLMFLILICNRGQAWVPSVGLSVTDTWMLAWPALLPPSPISPHMARGVAGAGSRHCCWRA